MFISFLLLRCKRKEKEPKKRKHAGVLASFACSESVRRYRSGSRSLLCFAHARKYSALIAFTLAEILIVLGIIGLIADMTIPTLINQSQKRVAETRILKFYSSMLQAVRLSEIDNGHVSSWEFKSSVTKQETKDWFDKYFTPYLMNSTGKITKNEDDEDDFTVYLNDGSTIYLHTGTCVDFVYDIDGPLKGSQKNGKDIFPFILCPFKSHCNGFKEGFSTYKCEIYKQNPTREDFQTGILGCTKESTIRYYCTALIQYDGWKIADDYPW